MWWKKRPVTHISLLSVRRRPAGRFDGIANKSKDILPIPSPPLYIKSMLDFIIKICLIKTNNYQLLIKKNT